jgi:hypothetical protein
MGKTRKHYHYKLIDKLLLTQADKGKTIVILHHQEYNQKVVHFMECNHISEITKDLTEKYQKKVREQINKSDIILPKTEKWKSANLNPEAPTLKVLIKLHKENNLFDPSLVGVIHQPIKSANTSPKRYNKF